jgi:preprotein translocase subunit SecG
MLWLLFLLKFVLAATAVIIIILVLLQKGKGGGLAGALGGMGGQSAFGTKAGDLFTKITIGVAAVWIVVCIAAAKWSASLAGNPLADMNAPAGQAAPQNPGQTPPPSGEKPAGSATKPAAPATPEKPAVPEPSGKPGDKPGK